MTKKRAHGEGTVRRLPSGRWVWICMTGRGEDGRPIYIRLHADTRKQLMEVVAAYKQKKEMFPEAAMSFERFADTWYSRYKRNLRISSQTGYEFTLKKLKAYWKEKKLQNITASDVMAMLDYFCETERLSRSYLKKIRSMMMQILDAAEADGLIARNPVRHIKYRMVDVDAEKKVFTPEEITQFQQCSNSKVKDAVILLLATGMRTQELLALRGSDIAEDGSCIRIRRAVNMDGNVPVIGLTKNRSSRRDVPVPSSVQRIAARYAAYADKLIFESPKVADRPINPSSFRAAFTRLCKKARVQTLTPHCCRHTYVSQLQEHDVRDVVIKTLVGHSKRDITEHYTHLSWEKLCEAADELNHLFERGEE